MDSQDQTRISSVGSALAWIGYPFLLISFYLFVGPWIILLVFGVIPGVSAGDPFGKAVEWFFYPAFQLAETSELYGRYFWYALRGLGG